MKKGLKLIITIMLALMCVFIGACGNDSGVSRSEYESLMIENEKIKQEQEEIEQRFTELEKENEKIQSDRDFYAEELEKLQKEYFTYKESMKEYEILQEAEAEARRIEAQRIIDEQRAEEERKAAEEAEKKEQEEKAGYETGITYDQLARTPDDYKDEKVKFQGKVLQILEDADHDYIHMRLAVNGSYDDVLYCEYKKNIVSQRVLEDDVITIYGVSYGLYSYDTAIGSKVTIPAVLIDKIDQ